MKDNNNKQNNTTMSITEMKKDLVQSIKGVDLEISALRRRFYSKLPDTMSEEELHEDVVNYIYDNNDELQQTLNKIKELKNMNVDDIKVECWFWSKQWNKYCTIDLDEYYGGAYEGYRYKLIVGGENHGNLVINGYHEDNANDMDIIYKLGDLHITEYDTYTDDLRKIVQEYFNHWEPIKKSIKEDTDAFNRYIKNRKIEMDTDVYKNLDMRYSYILDYSDGGRKFYDALIIHSDVLLADINRRLNGVEVDHDYFARCRELKTLIIKVQTDIRDWYEKVYKYVGKIADNNIGVSDMSHNILAFV